jgi:hypothetical protein
MVAARDFRRCDIRKSALFAAERPSGRRIGFGVVVVVAVGVFTFRGDVGDMVVVQALGFFDQFAPFIGVVFAKLAQPFFRHLVRLILIVFGHIIFSSFFKLLQKQEPAMPVPTPCPSLFPEPLPSINFEGRLLT